MKRHEDLNGRTISIGPEGSGTHALALEFLARVGIIDEITPSSFRFAPEVATEKLLHGEIDGVALLASWESPVVRQLVSAQDIVLASVPRADAFVALYPFLNKVVLPAGVGDMVKNRPPTMSCCLRPRRAWWCARTYIRRSNFCCSRRHARSTPDQACSAGRGSFLPRNPSICR